MSGPIVVSLDQLYRPRPGGIGTYTLGLLQGLVELGRRGELPAPVVGLVPAGAVPDEISTEAIDLCRAGLSERALVHVWSRLALGVPRGASVVHATTMAGPYSGGGSGAVHSVLVHDVLWRDHPELTTRRGVAFHDRRLRLIVRRGDLRVLATSPGLRDRLVAEGVAPERIHLVTLGIAPIGPATKPFEDVLARLGLGDDVAPGGAYCLAVGTVQPRKNLERLILAHARARQAAPDIGPLVLAGARGWGDVDTTGALVVGEVDAPTRDALVAHCRIACYVPVEEGWGLPAVEALAAGRPLVVSRTVPSVGANDLAVRVDPLDVDDICAGILLARDEEDTGDARRRRRDSVAHLDWAACARGHLAAWS